MERDAQVFGQRVDRAAEVRERLAFLERRRRRVGALSCKQFVGCVIGHSFGSSARDAHRAPARRSKSVAHIAALTGARGAAFLADEPRDRAEPRAETRAVGQTLAHAEGAQEGLLHGVLCVLPRAGSDLLAAEREEERSVAVVEPSARTRVARVERLEIGAVVVQVAADGFHVGVVSDFGRNRG